MLPAGFEPAAPSSEWPQTFALDRSDTGIGQFLFIARKYKSKKRAHFKVILETGKMARNIYVD
jgi:hypothetical protein